MSHTLETENIPTITYSLKWFNPLFFILEDIVLKRPKIKRVLIYGGKSSSKTISVSQLLAKQGLEQRQSSILFRKESARVKTTIKKSFDLGIKTTRLQNGWEKQDRSFKSVSGAEVILTGLDDEDKAKGVEGFNFVLFDELDQFEENEYAQTNLSLRGEGRKVFFATWNPVSKLSWVKTKLVDTYLWETSMYELPDPNSFVKISSCGTTVLIKTSYKDNYWSVGSPCGTYGYVDHNLIEDYEKLRLTNYNRYKVNVLGEWGNVNVGGEFYKNFRTEAQVRKHTYNPELPLHISFDENVNPYLTLSIYQAEGKRSWKIGEICLEHPLNTLTHTLKKFYATYKPNSNTVFIYGDRTSLKADTKLEKGHNFFSIIEDKLSKYGYKTKTRLPNKNPGVAARGNFINDIFAANIFGIEYTISDNCLRTIDDYENVKEDSDGTKLKKKVRHPVTKVSYEQFGHLTDTDDYFICEYYKEEFKEYISEPEPTVHKTDQTLEELGIVY